MKPTPKCSLFNSLSSDRSKVTKRSKTYFDHNTLSFRPIHMKPTPKYSLFNSLSSDMVTNVALAKVCALPSSLCFALQKLGLKQDAITKLKKGCFPNLHKAFVYDLSVSEK